MSGTNAPVRRLALLLTVLVGLFVGAAPAPPAGASTAPARTHSHGHVRRLPPATPKQLQVATGHVGLAGVVRRSGDQSGIALAAAVAVVLVALAGARRRHRTPAPVRSVARPVSRAPPGHREPTSP